MLTFRGAVRWRPVVDVTSLVAEVGTIQRGGTVEVEDVTPSLVFGVKANMRGSNIINLRTDTKTLSLLP